MKGWACCEVNWGRSPNRLRARSARGVLRTKPEPRARSAREFRAKPESRAKPEIERGRGLGRGRGEPLPRNFLKIRTWNRAIWCIVEAKIYNFSQWRIQEFAQNADLNSSRISYVSLRKLYRLQWVCGEAPASNDFSAFKKNALFRRDLNRFLLNMHVSMWWSKYKPQFDQGYMQPGFSRMGSTLWYHQIFSVGSPSIPAQSC